MSATPEPLRRQVQVVEHKWKMYMWGQGQLMAPAYKQRAHCFLEQQLLLQLPQVVTPRNASTNPHGLDNLELLCIYMIFSK